jgi:hypothetical protein
MTRKPALGIALLISFMVLLTGCVSAREIQRYPSLTPTPVPPASRSVAIYRIVSSIPAGTEVGTIQAGAACVGQGRQFWKITGDLEPAAFASYAARAGEEFRRAGYLVLGNEPVTTGAALFQPPTGPMPDFLIAAVIRSIASNVCYPWSGFGNVKTLEGEASMEIEWQIFDPASQRVVLSRIVGGHGVLERGDHAPRGPVHEALAASARNLLADGTVVTLLLSARGQAVPMVPPPPPPPLPPPPPK